MTAEGTGDSCLQQTKRLEMTEKQRDSAHLSVCVNTKTVLSRKTFKHVSVCCGVFDE